MLIIRLAFELRPVEIIRALFFLLSSSLSAQSPLVQCSSVPNMWIPRSTPAPTFTCWTKKFAIETDVNDINLSSLLLADCGSGYTIQVFRLFTYSLIKCNGFWKSLDFGCVTFLSIKWTSSWMTWYLCSNMWNLQEQWAVKSRSSCQILIQWSARLLGTLHGLCSRYWKPCRSWPLVKSKAVPGSLFKGYPNRQECSKTTLARQSRFIYWTISTSFRELVWGLGEVEIAHQWLLQSRLVSSVCVSDAKWRSLFRDLDGFRVMLQCHLRASERYSWTGRSCPSRRSSQVPNISARIQKWGSSGSEDTPPKTWGATSQEFRSKTWSDSSTPCKILVGEIRTYVWRAHERGLRHV